LRGAARLLRGLRPRQPPSHFSVLPPPFLPPLHAFGLLGCDLAGGFRGVHSLVDSLKDRFEGEGVSLLVMSPGYFSLEGRVENDDGVDKKMAVHLYSRMLVTKALIPLLEEAAEKDPKQGARVLTVLDSRRNGGHALNLADLGLERTYSVASYARHATAMSNVMIEQLAARHPSIAFTHAFPGIVNTNIFNHAPGLPSILKLALRPFTPLFTVSPETCADRLGKVLWQERYRTGAWRVDEHGEPIEVTRPTTEEQGRAVWEHVSGLVDRRWEEEDDDTWC